MTRAIGSSGGSGGNGTMPAPPSRLELRVDLVLRVEIRPRTLALRALSAPRSVRALRTDGGAVRDDRVEAVAPLTDAPTNLWPQLEQ
jgi:hypothetical protein